MNKRFSSPLRQSGLLAAMVMILMWLPRAGAEIVNCTAITSLPTVITTQGIYCLTGHLSTGITSGNAIDIQAHNVMIDLNGYKLGGLAAGDSTEAYGIYAYQRKNIVIRNGIIRGFNRAIWLRDESPYTASQGHLIEDLLTDNNTYIGIMVQGRGSRVLHNQVVDTSGSTVIDTAFGIVVYGPGNDVINNRVSTTIANSMGNAYGIFAWSADDTVVEGNRVSDTADTGGISTGIYVGGSSSAVIARNNTIATADYGLYFSSSTGKYMGNLTNDIAITAFTGGTPVGTND